MYLLQTSLMMRRTMMIEFWPTKTDGVHIVLVHNMVAKQIGVLWI
jgi:hypothetical protein